MSQVIYDEDVQEVLSLCISNGAGSDNFDDDLSSGVARILLPGDPNQNEGPLCGKGPTKLRPIFSNAS